MFKSPHPKHGSEGSNILNARCWWNAVGTQKSFQPQGDVTPSSSCPHAEILRQALLRSEKSEQLPEVPKNGLRRRDYTQ